jgi:NAD(P)-dependent dehydrogenase (short-subunit alcohol dehydrogenase family)
MKFAKQCGPLDGLFLNAGSFEIGNVEKGDLSIFDRMLRNNLLGPWHMAHYLGPLLTEGSSVVFTGSNVGIRAVPLQAAYGVAKAGVHMLALYLSQEWASRQIRVNAIAPGPVATDMLLDRIKESLDPEKSLNDLKMVNPLHRIGQVEEIASLVVYLLGSESQWLSGTVIPIDGGAGAVQSN